MARYVVWIFAALMVSGNLACLMPGPLVSYRDPKPVQDRSFRAGIDASVIPFLAHEMPGLWTGRGDGFGLVGEVGFCTNLRSTKTLDYRLRLSVTGSFPIDEDDDSHNIYYPAASFEAKFSNESGSFALVMGGSVWWVAAPNPCPDCGEASPTIWPMPLASTWLAGVFALGNPGETRVLISVGLSPALAKIVGALLVVTAGLDVPLGKNSSFRPEVSVHCFVYSESQSSSSSEDPYYGCMTGGGVGVRF